MSTSFLGFLGFHVPKNVKYLNAKIIFPTFLELCILVFLNSHFQTLSSTSI